MREIVLDTETTGLAPEAGDRIVEIGCVELVNHVPTGRTYHQYLNPERAMPAEAFAVHGLGDDFLADKPRFGEIADAFLRFVGDAGLVIHNAEFDIKFLDAELVRAGRPPLGLARATDTLALARKRFPGAPASLDALLKRFEVDGSARVLHGALLDCELLAEVYLHLLGGRQPGFAFAAGEPARAVAAKRSRPRRAPRPHAPSAQELEAHRAFVGGLDDPLWARFEDG
ncbi:MAG: DNA polymerase III subunit epsilon [Alphaproteobacteria bacterium]